MHENEEGVKTSSTARVDWEEGKTSHELTTVEYFDQWKCRGRLNAHNVSPHIECFDESTSHISTKLSKKLLFWRMSFFGFLLSFFKFLQCQSKKNLRNWEISQNNFLKIGPGEQWNRTILTMISLMLRLFRSNQTSYTFLSYSTFNNLV